MTRNPALVMLFFGYFFASFPVSRPASQAVCYVRRGTHTAEGRADDAAGYKVRASRGRLSTHHPHPPLDRIRGREEHIHSKLVSHTLFIIADEKKMSSSGSGSSGGGNDALSLPSLTDLWSQLSSFFTRDKLLQGLDKLVNLYLPIAYTYVSYRIPALARLGAFVQQSSVYLTVRQRIMELMAPSPSTGSKKDDGPNPSSSSSSSSSSGRGVIGAAQQEIANSLVSVAGTGKQVIGKIVDNTVTGKVIKRLVAKNTGNNRSRISEGEEEAVAESTDRKEETTISQPDSTTTTETTEESEEKAVEAKEAKEETSPSSGRKVIFPQSALPLSPPPDVTARLEDRGPSGWREASRLNSQTLETHL